MQVYVIKSWRYQNISRKQKGCVVNFEKIVPYYHCVLHDLNFALSKVCDVLDTGQEKLGTRSCRASGVHLK